MRRALFATGMALMLGGCATLPSASENPPSDARAPLPSEPVVIDSATVMVNAATAMLGQPYRYGGVAPGGFDCSGLAAYAAGSAGIRLPRTAQEQLHAGMPVRPHHVQAGDLVFMHLAHKELHVGIAIDDKHFIHAPSTGGKVRIDSLAAAPYAAGFFRARRVTDTAALPSTPRAN